MAAFARDASEDDAQPAAARTMLADASQPIPPPPRFLPQFYYSTCSLASASGDDFCSLPIVLSIFEEFIAAFVMIFCCFVLGCLPLIFAAVSASPIGPSFHNTNAHRQAADGLPFFRLMGFWDNFISAAPAKESARLR